MDNAIGGFRAAVLAIAMIGCGVSSGPDCRFGGEVFLVRHAEVSGTCGPLDDSQVWIRQSDESCTRKWELDDRCGVNVEVSCVVVDPASGQRIGSMHNISKLEQISTGFVGTSNVTARDAANVGTWSCSSIYNVIFFRQ